MDKLSELKKYAELNYVPISRPDAVEFLSNLVKEHNYRKILEIGTAIGYTSIILASVSKEIMVTTIERNEEMYKEAVKNIKEFNLEKQINVIFDDALNVELDDTFDLIYIDAAKSQNIKFIEKFGPLLYKYGIIVVDNILLKDVIKNAKPKKAEQLLKKTQLFKDYLATSDIYKVEYLDDIGDGFALIRRLGN